MRVHRLWPGVQATRARRLGPTHSAPKCMTVGRWANVLTGRFIPHVDGPRRCPCVQSFTAGFSCLQTGKAIQISFSVMICRYTRIHQSKTKTTATPTATATTTSTSNSGRLLPSLFEGHIALLSNVFFFDSRGS